MVRGVEMDENLKLYMVIAMAVFIFMSSMIIAEMEAGTVNKVDTEIGRKMSYCEMDELGLIEYNSTDCSKKIWVKT